jgi:hypothetical protein
MVVLRADITFLPNHDTQRGLEKFHEITRDCTRNNWPRGQVSAVRQERRTDRHLNFEHAILNNAGARRLKLAEGEGID